MAVTMQVPFLYPIRQVLHVPHIAGLFATCPPATIVANKRVVVADNKNIVLPTNLVLLSNRPRLGGKSPIKSVARRLELDPS